MTLTWPAWIKYLCRALAERFETSREAYTFERSDERGQLRLQTPLYPTHSAQLRQEIRTMLFHHLHDGILGCTPRLQG